MSRGSSILAGLILVGTLSALAVILDGSAGAVRVAQNTGSQSAAVLARHGPLHAEPSSAVKVIGSTPSKDKDAAKEGEVRQCEPNFNYKVLVDPKSGKTKVICTIPDSIPYENYRCPGKYDGCDNAEDVKEYLERTDYTSIKIPEGKFWQDFKKVMDGYCAQSSQLKLCAPQNLEKEAKAKEDDKSCVFSSCNLKDADKGVVAKAKKGAAEHLPLLLTDAKVKLDTEDLKALKMTQGVLKQDKTTAAILLKGLKDEEILTDSELIRARRNLATLESFVGTEGAPSDLQDQIKEAKADIEQLEAQKARLASATKELESKDGPPAKDGPSPSKDVPPPGPGSQGPGGQGDPRNPYGGKDGNTFPKLPMMPMQPKGGQGGQGQGQGQNPQQCYNYQQYSAQNNAYCANGSIYAYNTQTCQYQIQLQCPSGQCNTQNLTSDMYGRQISTQCAPTTPTNTQVTAQLTCTPRRIDLGSSVTLTYSCSQGTATGNGFTASGQNGTATVTPEKPPRGSTSVTYGLTCTGPQGQTVQASPCQVEVGVPTIVIVASPQNVESGKHTTLGWVTRGIKSCVIQSTDDRHREWNDAQKDKTNPSGTAKSPDLAADTVFELTCKTQEDKEKKSNVTVRIKS